MMVRLLKKVAVLFLGVVPGWVHATFTGPALWSHNSSSAFDLWCVLWIVAIGCFIASCMYEPSKARPTVGSIEKGEKHG